MPNGNIEYMGRMDYQVKIRGFRIERGEIENALRHNKTINSTVVVTKECEKGSIELAAYYSKEQERILQFFNFSFDGTTEQIIFKANFN